MNLYIILFIYLFCVVFLLRFYFWVNGKKHYLFGYNLLGYFFIQLDANSVRQTFVFACIDFYAGRICLFVKKVLNLTKKNY